MKKLSGWLYRKTTIVVALVSLLVFLAFAILVLPGQAERADTYSAEVGSPDTSLLYTPADLYQMAESYGQSGRQAYIRARFTFDLAFPLVYGLFLTTGVTWLLGKSLPEENRWRMLNLAPIAGVVFDLLENISSSLVISRYPDASPIFAFFAPIFTLIKWIFVGGSFGLLFIGIGLAVLARRK